MPGRLVSFRQGHDEKYWMSRMRDQDKTWLDPYVRWIDANETDERHLNKAADKKSATKFLILQMSEYDRDEIENINASIRTCTLPYIILCSGDIRFAPGAFSVLLRAIEGRSNPAPDFIYSDNDCTDSNGERFDPFFKPGWSPDTLMSFLYVGSVCVFRTELLKKIGGLRHEYGAAAYYDLVLRFTEKAKRFLHIPQILYHVMDRRLSGDKNDSFSLKAVYSNCYASVRDKQAEVKIKEEALIRRGVPGRVVWNDDYQEAEVRYHVQGEPLVSIIIPSKDHAEMLSECLRSVRDHTDYDRYELIIVDNGSGPEQKEVIEALSLEYGAKYLFRPMEFNFSEMCNLGAEKADGEYLLFLNDDIVAIQNDWLENMLGQAELSHVGAVGAKLLYPNDSLLSGAGSAEAVIQHAGILNLKIGPVHALGGKQDERDIYHHRNRVTYDFSAVTGACLMISKDKYMRAGGMDERLFVAYNDVALCFRLLELGYHNCLRNDVSLLHYESVSRGLDEQSERKRERLEREKTILENEFPYMEKKDPYYSRNLSQIANDYSINLINITKPCLKLSKPLKDTHATALYAIDQIVHTGDVWEITGWMSAGRWNEYIVRRYLVLESAKGEGLVFRLNRIRMDDSKLDNIRNDLGELFTPFVWFKICIEEKVLKPDEKYEIVLVMKKQKLNDVVIRTKVRLHS